MIAYYSIEAVFAEIIYSLMEAIIDGMRNLNGSGFRRLTFLPALKYPISEENKSLKFIFVKIEHLCGVSMCKIMVLLFKMLT